MGTCRSATPDNVSSADVSCLEADRMALSICAVSVVGSAAADRAAAMSSVTVKSSASSSQKLAGS